MVLISSFIFSILIDWFSLFPLQVQLQQSSGGFTSLLKLVTTVPCRILFLAQRFHLYEFLPFHPCEVSYALGVSRDIYGIMEGDLTAVTT